MMTASGPVNPVISALGLVTPWGLGADALREGVASGRLPDPPRCPEVNLADYLPSEKTYLDRCTELALMGAALALHEGQVDLTTLDRDRLGVGLGTAWGCLDTMLNNTQRVQRRGLRFASPLLFMHSFVNAPASLIAIEWGIRGPGGTFTDGALSFASALCWADDLLRRGAVDLMLVGGVEALSEPLLAGVSADPGLSAYRPPIEAAAFMILETPASCDRRGGRPLAELQEVTLGTVSQEIWAGGKELQRAAENSPEGNGPYASGAQFALDLVAALGDGPATRREVHLTEGGRFARAVARLP